MRFILVAVLAALALGAPATTIGPVPSSSRLDSESSAAGDTILPVPYQSFFNVNVDFTGTASNNIEIAVGSDSDSNGVLSYAETSAVVGWDCGVYFVERVCDGRRFEYAAPFGSSGRFIDYGVVLATNGIASFTIRTGDGYLTPGGLAGTATGSEWASLYYSECPRMTVRHVLTWEVLYAYPYYSTLAAFRDVVFGPGLSVLRESGGLEDLAEALGQPGAFFTGTFDGWNVYGATFYPVPVDFYDSGRRTRARFETYVDGGGDLSFYVETGSDGCPIRFYCDGVCLASRPARYTGTVNVTIPRGPAYSDWLWFPGVDTVLVTSRGENTSVTNSTYEVGRSGGFVRFR